MTSCNESIEMSSSSSRRLLESKEEAVSVVQAILKQQKSIYELVDFETFNKTARLRSQHYRPYFVLCFKNATRSSGWLVCPCLMKGGCQSDKSVSSFSTIQGSASKSDRHIRLQTQTRATTSCFVRTLPRAAKQTIAQSAAYAVAFDLRPLSFCDGHPGMSEFAKALVELRQTVPVHENVEPMSYFPGQTAVTTAVKEFPHSMQKQFLEEMIDGCIKHRGAVSADWVHLKANGKHYYDFTVHFMRIKCDNSHDEPAFQFDNNCLMLIEGPKLPTASHIRRNREAALLREYQIGLDHFLKNITMVTDSASVMARVANASVSAELHGPDETWMGCGPIFEQYYKTFDCYLQSRQYSPNCCRRFPIDEKNC